MNKKEWLKSVAERHRGGKLKKTAFLLSLITTNRKHKQIKNFDVF